MSASCELFVFHTTQRCHSVFSCLAPDASFHERLVARENVATRLPPVVERTSGSFPRFPISVTLFKLRLTNSSWREVLGISPRTMSSNQCGRTIDCMRLESFYGEVHKSLHQSHFHFSLQAIHQRCRP